MVILKGLEVEPAILVLVENFIEGLAGEGRLAEGEDVEDDAQAEEIACCRVDCLIAFQVSDFRGHVPWGPATHEHQLPTRTLGQSEVSDHALAIGLAKEHVLWFEVPVHEALGV